LITAGIAPFRRRLSPRATVSDLWASLETALSDPHGFGRLERIHTVKLAKGARLRARAFLNQARQYYGPIAGVEPVAKPLLGYYFALNLVKAFLTTVDPETTAQRLGHGLRQSFNLLKNYSFKRECLRVEKKGVFRLLATRTGSGHCWDAEYEIGLHELLPYLPDGYALYADSYEKYAQLLPIEDVGFLFGEGKKAWLRVEVSRGTLQQRAINPQDLLMAARIFGSRFKLVTSEEETASYESVACFRYGKRRSEVLDDLCGEFDRTLIACDRSFPGTQRFIVLSPLPRLLSHEAVTFAVLHHLSSMVRYRPDAAERLLRSRHAWLLTSWVDRACESFLLNIASRITREEHVIA
jgi:hypothetical protein